MIVARIYEVVARDGKRYTRAGVTAYGRPIADISSPDRGDALDSLDTCIGACLEAPPPHRADHDQMLRDAVKAIEQAAIAHGVNDEVGQAVAYATGVLRHREGVAE